MIFSTELELQNKFIQIYHERLLPNEWLLDEFNARFGNVDIVRVKTLNNDYLTFEQATLLSSYQCAKVVAFLHKNAIRTFDYLAKKTDYDTKALKNIINKLVKVGIVNEIKVNRYVISSSFRFPNFQFNSYEAKLKDWKKAIIQASINKKFSSFSYVVLPMNLAEKLHINNFKIFELYNVGLVGVSQTEIKYCISPKKNKRLVNLNTSFIRSVAKYQLETKVFSLS